MTKKEIDRKYYLRNKEKVLKRVSEYYQKNKDKVSARKKDWWKNKKEQL